MTAVYLTEADVDALANTRMAIEAVKEAFLNLGGEAAANVPRSRAIASGIVLHTMSAAASYKGVVGWKCYTTTRQGASFLVGLYSQETGELLALVEANRLGQLRTGATTAVAAECLAAPAAVEMGLFGAGWQAAEQLAAVAVVRHLKCAYVYSRNAAKRLAFAQQMTKRLGMEIVAVDRPQEACEDLPIVVTATTSREPVFDGGWLAEGTLICAIGSNWRHRAEVDTTVIRRADNVVCDSVECCRNEAGDFADAIEKGVFDWSRAVELADVLAGRVVGRRVPESIVLFKSVGMAIEDVALGAKVLERARREGRGTALPF